MFLDSFKQQIILSQFKNIQYDIEFVNSKQFETTFVQVWNMENLEYDYFPSHDNLELDDYIRLINQTIDKLEKKSVGD